MTTPTLTPAGTDRGRAAVVAAATTAALQLATAWEALAAAQRAFLTRLQHITTAVGRAAAIRNATTEYNARIAAFDRDARAVAERWASVDLPTLYRDGALHALERADADTGVFTWTTNHQAAVTALTATFWADLVRRITEAVRRAQAFARAAVTATRTPQGPTDQILADHPLGTVIYANQARHPVREWAMAALLAQAATTANRAAVQTGVDELTTQWFECTDGPECVMPGGKFLPHGHLQQMVRSWFSGPAYSIGGSSPSGPYLLTVGPNHPVLTSRGWVRAHLLREGDELVYDRLCEDTSTRSELDLEQVPCVEDVYASLMKVLPLSVRPTTGNDLHGDGQFCESEVDVVRVAGSLLLELNPSRSEHLGEYDLVRADDRIPRFVGPGGSEQRTLLVARPSDSIVGCLGTFFPGFGSGVRMPQRQGFRAGSADTHLVNSAVHLFDGEAQDLGYLRWLASLFEVEASYLLTRELYGRSARAGVPAEPSLGVVVGVKGGSAHLTGGDLPVGSSVGLPHRISLSRVESITIRHYEGWVYDATTSGGTYSIDGFIVANCGFTAHQDLDHASGTLRSADAAATYPIAHPGCIRSWTPRPDLAGRTDITDGDPA